MEKLFETTMDPAIAVGIENVFSKLSLLLSTGVIDFDYYTVLYDKYKRQILALTQTLMGDMREIQVEHPIPVSDSDITDEEANLTLDIVEGEDIEL